MSTSIGGILFIVVLVLAVSWGLFAYSSCKCQVKSDATGQTCGREVGIKCFPMKILGKECEMKDCKFGTCATPSCSDKGESDCTEGAGCTWNKGRDAIPGACTRQEGKTEGDCASKTTQDACTNDENCSWTDAQPKVEGSCSNDDTDCGMGDGNCKAPCVYSPPKKENFASGPRRFILRNEDHLRRMLRDAGWDGQGGGWCPFANGIGCG